MPAPPIGNVPHTDDTNAVSVPTPHIDAESNTISLRHHARVCGILCGYRRDVEAVVSEVTKVEE
jgi:hypothetical protein